MSINVFSEGQDFHFFADRYRELYPDDVLTLDRDVVSGQDVTAMVEQLAAANQHPMLVCQRVDGLQAPLVTNVFASRTRLARLLGVEQQQLHETFQTRANAPVKPRVVSNGPITDEVIEGDAVDLALLPMIQHFETDRAPYITIDPA